MGEDLARNDGTELVFDVSDDALEAAGSPRTGPIMSFPTAPTVSILVVCSGNDVSATSPTGS